MKDMLPFSGITWHALLANGACGWYQVGTLYHVAVRPMPANNRRGSLRGPSARLYIYSNNVNEFLT